MSDLIVAVVILVIISLAIIYIVKEKKKGTACIGCPHAGTCGNKKSSGDECGCK
ncbi:MAG: FeoB-associated Cys-rich membrane protein [Lachnospiraceae bacterium]|nr:FeoB-associated Cys-rich membrane protein [Lachnospiraceae bacterium]